MLAVAERRTRVAGPFKARIQGADHVSVAERRLNPSHLGGPAAVHALGSTVAPRRNLFSRIRPGVETPGYLRMSLRDTGQPRRAAEKNGPSPAREAGDARGVRLALACFARHVRPPPTSEGTAREGRVERAGTGPSRGYGLLQRFIGRHGDGGDTRARPGKVRRRAEPGGRFRAPPPRRRRSGS